ncbi:hypothetical protein C9J27_16060 [Photobacterium kishitanii]|uniref:Uncharacterized protein n=1 Tax=Photobacterium kishitanii TaxID=318456 RepID=A0A2T3KFU1_9GAMM|nr:hypothetical protein C9J27_16060 [Photobacterium kishitanii]
MRFLSCNIVIDKDNAVLIKSVESTLKFIDHDGIFLYSDVSFYKNEKLISTRLYSKSELLDCLFNL